MGKAEKIEPESALERGAKKIHALREKRAALEAERPRLVAIVEAAGAHGGEIERLRQARTEAQAVALIDSHEADTGPLDKRIAQAEHDAAKAIADGKTARAALVLLDERSAAIAGELKTAESDQLKAALSALGVQRQTVLATYNDCVAALREPLLQLVALDAASSRLRERQAALAGNPYFGSHGGGLGTVLVNALADKGLVEVLIERLDLRMPPWLRWPQAGAQCGTFQTEFFKRAGLD